MGNFLKSIKAADNLIFSNCLVVLLGEWGTGRSHFHIWTNFTNHFCIGNDFYKSLIWFYMSILVVTRAITHCFHDLENRKIKYICTIHAYTFISIYLSIYLSVCLSICLSIYLSIDRSINRSIYITLSFVEKLKKTIFENAILAQTWNMNNLM